MSSLVIFFFLLCLSMHACNARRLGFIADIEETGSHVDFLPNKDVVSYKLKPHHDQLQELQEVEVHGRTIQDNLNIGANNMMRTLLNSFLKAKEAFAKAISEHNEMVISSGVDLRGMEKVEGLKRVSRSMLGNSGGDTEEAVGSEEKDNVRDIDVMDYAQPHRKPPIHNEKN